MLASGHLRPYAISGYEIPLCVTKPPFTMCNFFKHEQLKMTDNALSQAIKIEPNVINGPEILFQIHSSVTIGT